MIEVLKVIGTSIISAIKNWKVMLVIVGVVLVVLAVSYVLKLRSDSFIVQLSEDYRKTVERSEDIIRQLTYNESVIHMLKEQRDDLEKRYLDSQTRLGELKRVRDEVLNKIDVIDWDKLIENDKPVDSSEDWCLVKCTR